MAQTVTFPRQTFAKLSPHPFLLAGLQPSSATAAPSRTNGRGPHETRAPQVNTGSLTHAHGSAVVRIGDTTVICGVRGEVLPAANIPNYRRRTTAAELQSTTAAEGGELRDYDLLVPNIELATGCAPSFLPGVPPTPLAQTLSTRVYSLLHATGLVAVEDLRIWHAREKMDKAEGEGMEVDEDEKADESGELGELMAYWTLYIDVLFISFDGNPFDAAWAAIVAALRDTKLPKAWWDADRDMVLCSRAETVPLTIKGLPIACTASVFTEKKHERTVSGQWWLLLDPDRLEESLCDESVSMVIDRSTGETRIRSLSKYGGAVVNRELIKKFVTQAEERWEEFQKVISG